MNYKSIEQFYKIGDIVQIVTDDSALIGRIDAIIEDSLYLKFFNKEKKEDKQLIIKYGMGPNGAEGILINVNNIKYIIKLIEVLDEQNNNKNQIK